MILQNRQVTSDEAAYQLQISHGSAYENIHNRLPFHKVCAWQVQKQLKNCTKRNVWISANGFWIAMVLKVTISWRESSWEMKQRVNNKVWNGNILTCPSRDSSKRIQPQESLCLQFLGLTRGATGTSSREGFSSERCSLEMLYDKL